jgi:hypothetical protein
VGDGPELRRLVDAGVDGDHRDAGLDGRLGAVAKAVRVGHRHHDAVHLVRDRLVDGLRLRRRVGV